MLHVEAGTTDVVSRRPRKPITNSIHSLGSEIHVSTVVDDYAQIHSDRLASKRNVQVLLHAVRHFHPPVSGTE